MNDEDLIDMMTDFMQQHPEEFDDELIRKVRERAILIEDASRPGWIVVDVERHRGILGRRYKRGEPLDSFITYWERYAYDPKASKMEPLGRQRASEFHIEVAYDLPLEDVYFEVRDLGSGRFLVTESCVNERAEVEDLSGAEALADRLVDEMDLSSYLEEDGDALGPGQREEYCDALRRAFKKAMREKVAEAWSQMEPTED